MSRTKTRSFSKWILFASILVISLGVLKVNLKLAEVVKPSSAFETIVDKDPLLLTVKVGDLKIKFNGARFEDFFNGIYTIMEAIF